MKGRAAQKITWVTDLCDDPLITIIELCEKPIANSIEMCIFLRKNLAEKCGDALCYIEKTVL